MRCTKKKDEESIKNKEMIDWIQCPFSIAVSRTKNCLVDLAGRRP